MRHSLAGRVESQLQARLLAELSDEGPLSKAQLADALQVSRTTVGAEVVRLGELGLAVEVGPAASRGGRRSTLVDLSPDIRFAGIAIGATGLSVGVTDGRLITLGVQHRECDIKQGPEVVLALALEMVREVMAEVGRDRAQRRRCRRARARSTSTAGSRSRRRSCRAGTATRCATPCPATWAARSCSTTTSTCSRWASSTPASPRTPATSSS